MKIIQLRFSIIVAVRKPEYHPETDGNTIEKRSERHVSHVFGKRMQHEITRKMLSQKQMFKKGEWSEHVATGWATRRELGVQPQLQQCDNNHHREPDDRLTTQCPDGLAEHVRAPVGTLAERIGTERGLGDDGSNQ
jgi:hypothetical protein